MRKTDAELEVQYPEGEATEGRAGRWKICEDQFRLEDNLNQESIFTLANGYLGIRGSTEEKLDPCYSKRGTFINGFYEKSTIHYGESAYGFAKNMETMVNVCDARQVELLVDGERFSLTDGTLCSCHRELDMEHALETRTLLWEAPSGKRVKLRNCHIVSMTRQHVTASVYEATPLNFSGKLKFNFLLDGNGTTGEESFDPRVSSSLGDGSFTCTDSGFVEKDGRLLSFVRQSTGRTGRSVCCASVQKSNKKAENGYRAENHQTISSWQIEASQGERIVVENYVSYVTDQRENEETFEEKAFSEALKAMEDGWEVLCKEQSHYMREFWNRADIRIDGDEDLTRSMRFNIFHLLQSVGKDSYTSIASKGLSGEGYGGHYFWESEAYIAPVFMFTKPDIARSMLEYRYHILNQARQQARLLGHQKGALYAWRTIGGEESSAYFPAGSAQYHINADIAFAVNRYVDSTQDRDFLVKKGLEILIETARLWIDVGHYCQTKGGAFCIDGVTGPDEYTAIVDNNCYTNLMARENLQNAVKWAKSVRQEEPEAYHSLSETIGFEDSELDEFQNAADKMYIPYHEGLEIHMQDDTFLSKKALDLTTIPEEKRPLLLHYHPLFLYRHQVCKQADLLLAEYFLPDKFTKEEKKRDYDYYEKITTHDSSLSACVFSIMAAETGDLTKAYNYFVRTIRTDLDDNQKNTKDGLHMANMAGAWACVIHGFAGLSVSDGSLWFRPLLPDSWQGYQFTVSYRGQELFVHVSPDGTRYALQTAGRMRIRHNGEELLIESNVPCLVPHGVRPAGQMEHTQE